MPAPAYFLGLDVDRAGLGLLVLAADGTVVATLRRAYGSDAGAGLEPQDWWRAARTGIKEILRRAGLRPDQIRCIGLTGDEACVALAQDGKVLCAATLGPDPRATAQVEAMTRTVGQRNLLNLASGPATTSATAVKLLWLREREKRVWHDLAYVLPAKDFLRYRLTDTFTTDASDAAATLLFNPKTRSWSKQLLALLELNASWLPAIAAGTQLSGRVSDSAARDAGLQAGTPVVAGAGHAAAIAISAGVLHPGAAVIELGGHGSLFAPTPEAIKDPQGRLLSTCHSLAGTWALAANDLAGSASLDWLMDHVLPAEVAQARRNQRDPLDLLAELAAEVPPGSDGLVFIAPNAHPATSGFIGLEPRHGRGHLVRAVMEGGALACAQALQALTDLKKTPETIHVSGPGAGNHLWCQILADVIDRPVTAHAAIESAAHGASLLASSAVGVFKGIDEACNRLAKPKATFNPRRAATEVYAGIAPVVARLPAAIAHAISPEPDEVLS
jgi:xylulokinase